MSWWIWVVSIVGAVTLVSVIATLYFGLTSQDRWADPRARRFGAVAVVLAVACAAVGVIPALL